MPFLLLFEGQWVLQTKNANLLGKSIRKDFGGLLQTLPSNRWYTGGEQIVFKVIQLKDSVGLKLRFPGSSPVL